MFFSSIEADYTKMGYPKAIVRALDFLKNTDVKSLPVGSKNPLEGDKMYYNVDEVMTKDFSETKPESHKDYIDIQFMVDGEEFAIEEGSIIRIAPEGERAIKAGGEELVYICMQTQKDSLTQATYDDGVLTESKASWM